ncbi:hypothetical protein FOMG_15901 [Fusarium oxysporum f. sp. melonis 26406]|uniref:DUF7025 domain-containing protein n=1 Tax=Fusarium oxysporum f. sp. melonis 26406 TaxID=1089452 RepID=W9ZHA8_FUSOX|nr:hypothetical protein FOMG_15901 [Fusarium oxysporum f. sp. melonis 26406]
MKGLYTVFLAFTAVQATPTINSESKALNARAVDLKVQYYKDGGCTDYAVSIWPGTSNKCYGYSYSNTNSANIVSCGGRGVACTCYMFEQDNCKRLYTTKVPISRGISQKLGEGQSQDKASTFAILDYHEESPRTSSIDIKNPALKKGLTDVLSNYPDVYTEAPVLSTSPPFLPFLHRWDRFLQAEKASSEGTKDLYRILRHHLERGLKEPFRVLRDYQRTKYIEFDDLLVAVVPGELVARYRIGLLWAGVFLAASIGEFWGSKSCDLKVRMVNWDGTRFGYREKTWEIRAFQGFRKITDLPVFPLDADSDRGQIKQLLVGRGRMFHRLCSQHVKVYTGVLHFKQEGRKMAHLSERIIVDAYAFYKFQ